MKETEAAKRIALQAGSLLLEHYGQGGASTVKGERDLFTQADIAAQELIFNAIRKEFPAHELIGEEGFNGNIPTAERLWLVDPLDGTANFEASFPHFNVSIAVVDSTRGEFTPLAGAVYAPCAKELYSAEKGKGAFLNDKPIRISQRPLRESIAATYIPGNAARGAAAIGAMQRLHPNVRRIRVLSGGAMDCCLVAEGKLAAYFAFSSSPWDYAAANLIVTEAGGAISTADGSPWNLDSKSVVHANTQETLRAVVNAMTGGKQND